MTKESFTEKLIKRFYGIIGPLDECKRREVDRIGNRCFIYLTWLILISNVIAFFIGLKSPKVVALVYPLLLTFGLFLIYFCVMLTADQSMLKTIDLDDLTKREQKRLKHTGLKAGLSFGICMYCFSVIFNHFTDHIGLVSLLLSPRNIMGASLSGLAFGFITFSSTHSRLKK